MTRNISDEQRGKLFRVASDLENPICEIQSFTSVLHCIVESLSDESDAAAVSIIAREIGKRERQLSEIHSQLFHGLHENPQRVEKAYAHVEAVKLARAS